MKTEQLIFPIYALVFFILTLPIMLNGFLPLVDINNHLARHYIASAIAEDANLRTYYDYSLAWFGNSISDLIRTAIGDHVSPYTFVRLTMGFYMVNFVFSVCVLYRIVKGHWGLWPLTSVLLVFNGNFQWGFENYLIGAPVVIYAIAALVATASRAFFIRLLVITGFTCALFFFHTLLGLIFGAAVLGFELQKTIEQGRGNRWIYFRRSLLIGLPFVLCIYAYAASQGHAENIDGSFTEFGGLGARLDGIASISSERFYLLFSKASIWETLILLFFILIAFMAVIRTGLRLQVDHRLKGLLIALLAVSLLMPAWVEGVAFIHYRTPFLLAAIFIGSTALIDFRPPVLMVLILTVAIIASGRIYGFHTVAKQHSTEIAALNQLLKKLPKGAKLMPVFGEKAPLRRRYHAAAFAVIERQALIPTLFQGMHGLKVRPDWRDYATTTVPAVDMKYLTYDETQGKYIFHKETPYKYGADFQMYYDSWDEKFSHVLLINGTDVPLEDRLSLSEVGTASVFTLYENTGLKH